MLSRICQELINLKREIIYLNSFLMCSDRLALCGSIFMIIGVLLPWFSVDSVTLIGLMSAGSGHLLFSVLTIMQVKKVAIHHIEAVKHRNLPLLPLVLRRIALNYFLIGIGSIIVSFIFLVYVNWHNAVIQATINIHLGFYLSLCSAMLIFASGVERFRSG